MTQMRLGQIVHYFPIQQFITTDQVEADPMLGQNLPRAKLSDENMCHSIYTRFNVGKDPLEPGFEARVIKAINSASGTLEPTKAVDKALLLLFKVQRAIF